MGIRWQSRWTIFSVASVHPFVQTRISLMRAPRCAAIEVMVFAIVDSSLYAAMQTDTSSIGSPGDAEARGGIARASLSTVRSWLVAFLRHVVSS